MEGASCSVGRKEIHKESTRGDQNHRAHGLGSIICTPSFLPEKQLLFSDAILRIIFSWIFDLKYCVVALAPCSYARVYCAFRLLSKKTVYPPLYEGPACLRDTI